MIERLLTTAIALMVSLSAVANADCPANNRYAFDFNNAPTASLSYASSYSYTATAPGGATSTIGIKFAASDLASDQVNGTTMPIIDNTILSTETGGKELTIGAVFKDRTPDITSPPYTITTTLTFASPIRDLTVKLHDIDSSRDQFRDWLYVVGQNGSNTYAPVMIGPYGNNNSGTSTATNSTVVFGPSSTYTPSINAFMAVGEGSSNNNNANNGNVLVSFSQPVTSVIIRYGNFPYQLRETLTGQQAIGISQISFCPMPAVTVTKTSTPFIAGGFKAPGNDIAYSITVNNSGGSAVDLNGLSIIDSLPSALTFYNGNYDGTTTGPIQIIPGTSGLSLASGNTTYSKDGTTYSYIPISGYDPAVHYVKITPTGSLASNSNVVFRFRARIN